MRCLKFISAIMLLSVLLSNQSMAKPDGMIIVSIPPLEYMMQRIVGDSIAVDSLVSTNGSPELFEPSPKELLKIQNADLYFALGLPFEKKWLATIRQQKSIDIEENCCQDLRSLDVSHTHIHDQHKDPHIWTDPVLSIEIARRMKDSVTRLFKDKEILFENNFLKLEQELITLDKEIRNQTQQLTHRTFIVSHPAWSYFSKRYALEQLSIEQEGKETGARARSRLLQSAKQKKISAVYHQAQLNSKSARLFADEINAEVIEINPLEYDHITNLKLTADLIVKSLNK